MLGRCGAAPWIIGRMGACRCAARRSFCARGWGGRSAGACGGRGLRCLPRKPVIWRPAPCSGGWLLLGRWPRRVCRGNCRAWRRARSWGRMACGAGCGVAPPGGWWCWPIVSLGCCGHRWSPSAKTRWRPGNASLSVPAKRAWTGKASRGNERWRPGSQRLSGPELGLGAAPRLRLAHLAQLGGPDGARGRPGRGHCNE